MVMNVTSLTGNGLRDWLIQRVTALVLASYTSFFLFYFLVTPPTRVEEWQALFSTNTMRIASLMALLSLVLHAWIGIWTVMTDYVKPVTLRLPLQIFIILGLIASTIWGITMLWGV